MGGVCSYLTSCLAWGIQHCNLLVVEWSWVLALRRRSLGELTLIDIMWNQEVSGGPMSRTRLSHLRGSGLTASWSTRTPSATWPGTWGVSCLVRSLRSSASIQLVFCRSCSACRCIFDVFVGRKVICTSYSSAILNVLSISSFMGCQSRSFAHLKNWDIFLSLSLKNYLYILFLFQHFKYFIQLSSCLQDF